MKLEAEQVLCRFHLSNLARHGTEPLYQWIVETAHREGLQGATILKEFMKLPERGLTAVRGGGIAEPRGPPLRRHHQLSLQGQRVRLLRDAPGAGPGARHEASQRTGHVAGQPV